MKSLSLLLVPLFVGAAQAAPQKVLVRTPDGVSLNAIFLKPAAGKPVVIMHHGFSSVKEEWNPLIDELAKDGLGALAYDARPPGAPWQKLVDDVGAAVQYLEREQHIDRQKIFLAGASLGANVCLKYAALTGNGKGVVLLSPGLNYQGLSTPDVITAVKAPVLIVASPVDGYAYQSSNELVRLSPAAKLWTSRKPGHGVQMFEEDLLHRLHQWFETQK